MSEECGSGPTPAPGTKRKEWGTLAWQLGIYRRRGALGYFRDCCGSRETADPSTPLTIPFGDEKLRSG